MGKIKVLDKSVSELIAAGEVIERPASIIKELLENSIDAGTTAVTVEIKNGGISFIRITDNGIGFEPEDVPVAFLRHATSKVANENDLEHIATLGFRGEALASIAAVSKVEMMSKVKGAPFGSRIVLHGGEVVSFEEAGCPDGTTILVRDLFYNVPARLKFLKKDVSEGNAIQSIIEKIAVSHPEISFKLIRDNKPVLHTAGDHQLLSAVYSVYGKEFASALLEVDYQYRGVSVKGYVSKPQFSRANRGMQHFFVNERYVKSKTCMAALEEAYKNAMMVGKFPACVLKVSLDCSLVDVNVHPAKVEVRFVEEKAVFEAVYFAVKTALSQADVLKVNAEGKKTISQVLPSELLRALHEEPKAATSQAKEKGVSTQKRMPQKEDTFSRMNAAQFQSLFQKNAEFHSAKQDAPAVPKQPLSGQGVQSAFSKQLQTSVQSKSEKRPVATEEILEKQEFQFLKPSSFKENSISVQEPSEENRFVEVLPEVSVRYIGELFRTYILFEANELFVMIDKHAAHERILFEKLKKELDLRESQLLLTPLKVRLTPEEYDEVVNHEDVFMEYGFRFRLEGIGTVMVLEAPLILHRYDLGSILQGIADNLSAGKINPSPEEFENLLHSVACRAAMKANEKNSPQELEELVKQVYLDDTIRHCPHGRPVAITMTKYEVEKKFGRHQ